MSRIAQPQAAASPHAQDQRVSIRLEAEILTDADTGRYELIVTTGVRTYDECTPEELRVTIADVREQLARVEKLADDFDAIAAEHVKAEAVAR